MTTDYEGYTIKIKQLVSGLWVVNLRSKSGSVKASSKPFRDQDAASGWAHRMIDRFRSEGFE